MLRIVLALVFAAIASTYPTDNPISESPNILLGPSDESDSPSVASSGDALFNTLAAVMDDCEPDSEEENEDRAPTASKRPDEDMLSTVTVRRCPSRNFVRFGRGRPDNFIRFGRGGKEDSNFIRFGRGKAGSNFIRLGRGGGGGGSGGGGERGSDNFIRFGRARSSNFVRFGRGRPDNFIRFGRGRDNNFLRFGRSGAMEETAPLGSSMQVDEDNNQRVGRGGKSGSNFIRLGRAGSSSFIRLGRDGEDQVEDEDMEERETRGKSNANFLRFGRRTSNGNFLRFGRSSNSGELRRGKLTDRNFIRLGRAGGDTYGEDTDTGSVRVTRSEKNRGFIRLGKRRSSEDYGERADSHLLRLGRDVEEIQEPPVLPSSEVTDDNDTSSRTRRSVPYPKPEDEEAQEGSYPVIIATSSGNSGNEDKVDSSLRYYSPLTPSGIPNYILAPELSLLAPLSGAESPNKRGRGDGHNRNYIRLG